MDGGDKYICWRFLPPNLSSVLESLEHLTDRIPSFFRISNGESYLQNEALTGSRSAGSHARLHERW